MQALKEAVDININKLKACETDAKVSRKDKIVVDPGQEWEGKNITSHEHEGKNTFFMTLIENAESSLRS